MENAQRLAHSLKGIAATLEARDLAEASATVEHALRDGTIDGLDAKIDAMEQRLGPAIIAVSGLETSAPVPAVQSGPPPADEKPSASRPRILVIDDEPSNLALLSDIFSDSYDVLAASDGKRGLELGLSTRSDLILLDVLMPGIDGFEVCRRLKAEPLTAHIPILFLTAHNEPDAETRGLELGAVDFIAKPFTPAAVRARVANHIALKRAQDQLSRMADTDALTGLANRRHFDEFLGLEYARHKRSGVELSVIFIDVDHFKLFNDTYGHVNGDDCLRRVAGAIGAAMARSTDLAARYGGEEFACILPMTDQDGAIAIAEKIRWAVNELHIAHSRSETADHVTVSLGVVTAKCTQQRSASNVVALADEQLYSAKQGGRNRCCAVRIA